MKLLLCGRRIPAINCMGTARIIRFIFCRRQMDVIVHFMLVTITEDTFMPCMAHAGPCALARNCAQCPPACTCMLCWEQIWIRGLTSGVFCYQVLSPNMFKSERKCYPNLERWKLESKLPLQPPLKSHRILQLNE